MMARRISQVVLAALFTLLAAGCGGGGGGTPNQFTGNWGGPWVEVGGIRSGTLSLAVEAGGNVVGTLVDTTEGTSSISGTVTDNGSLSAASTLPVNRPYTLTGGVVSGQGGHMFGYLTEKRNGVIHGYLSINLTPLQ
jgi:hypothetical protein